MVVLAWLLAIVIAVVVIAIVVMFLNRFYRKSTRDMALVRTGFGGQRILISGGCLALPFLHKVEEINMRTLRIEVRRAADKSVITEDRMRVDVELEFYVRVIPSQEGIATAAQALGAKSFTVDGIRNLLEGRFVDAVQAVSARHTMDSLHEGRAEFVAEISNLLRENLKQNGILLDSVSLTRLDQSAFSSFDENNAFNAVGLRKLAEIVAVNRKKRAEIEADADVSVRQTQLEATKQRLVLTQQEEQAQINQHLEIEKMRAASDAEAAKAREEAMIASEEARIGRERQTKATELAKQSEIRKIELDSQLAVEVKKVDSAIELAAKHVEEAKSRAQAELARAEVILAEEHVQTERDRAVADRSHEMALKRVNEQGAVDQAKAETEADVLLRRVRAESEAVRTKAEADRSSLLAKSEGERALIDAENSQSEELIRMKLEQYRLDRLPEIVSQMMKPAEKIESIRINQLSGFGGSASGASGGNGDGSQKTPINQVMDSILGMALQLPALRSIGDSIGVDFSSAVSAPPATTSPPTAVTERKPAPMPSAKESNGLSQRVKSRNLKEHSMAISRRTLLNGAGATAIAAGMPLRHALAADPIKLGAIQDNSGVLDIYGKPMVMATAMAVDEINKSGGLLGRQIELKQYDSQSNIALYTRDAQELVRNKFDVAHAGITSASREAIRQTFRRGNLLYFYNVLYEGGVCDRNCFCTGTTPAQAVEPIIDYAMKKWGNKVYVLAADYNYGQITAKWVSYYVDQRKGKTLATNFFPLDVSDFGSTIAKIQDAAPNFVVAALVGGAHMSFFRQWAASGMNKKIPLTSTTFGVGNEHLALSPAEGNGIVIAGNYSPELETDANKKFRAAWAKRYGTAKGIHELAVSQYQGIKLWAEGVRKAKSVEHDAVIKALETGVQIEGPAGTVKVDPPTHHCSLDIHLMVVKDQKLTILDTAKQRAPSDTARYCNLQKNPNDNKQYEVKI